MLNQLPVGHLMLYFVRSFGSLPLILALITQLLIIVNRFVSLRHGACIALGGFFSPSYFSHSFLVMASSIIKFIR